ncbi:MAG: GAF domain-containing protein [Solirubrobacteraceae bacterium]
MTEPVALESIMSCFRGVIPSSFATCSADATPNITYMSIVQYVDSERVALSRQFFNKTRANLDVNPYGQVRVVDPDTVAEYALDLCYLHTETGGAAFDAMAANLEALASQSGMGGVFRLRGVDVHHVLRCAPVGNAAEVPARQLERDVLGRLDEFTRRLSLCTDYGEASQTALYALEDLFGFAQSILLLRDDGGERLFAVAANGYPRPAAGAEVALGSGVIGVAAQRRQVVCVPNRARSRVMQQAVRTQAEQVGGEPAGPEIPLPTLEEPQSVAAAPLIVQGAVAGVLYLESDRVGLFGPHQERLLRTLGGYLAAALRALEADEPEPAAAPTREVIATPGGAPLHLTYYQADDSVFVDGEYVVKGVPGRILWKLANIHAAEGRDTFTNRELRLDESLGLPPGNDNLEARLLVLRKRLAGGHHGIEIERVGRGRFALYVSRPLEFEEVETSGPMRAAHGGPGAK